MKPGALLLSVVAFLILAGGAVMVATNLPRGIRNNNPGNIKELRGDSTLWQGERATDDDAVMEEFNTMADGIRALGKVLLNYQKVHGLNTVRGIIGRWAPTSENNTGAYVAAVAGKLGVTPDQPIEVRLYLQKLVKAICEHENGAAVVALHVKQADIAAGVARALA